MTSAQEHTNSAANPTDPEWWRIRQPEPQIVNDSAGVSRYVGRRWALFVGREFLCPAGHRIRDTVLALDHHVFRCTHKDDRHARECGVLIYIVTYLTAATDLESFPKNPAPKMAWGLELTPSELRFMQDNGIRRLVDVQAYLGAFWFKDDSSVERRNTGGGRG